MDDAFREAMHRAIGTGQEFLPTVVSTEQGTRRPKVVLGEARLAVALPGLVATDKRRRDSRRP